MQRTTRRILLAWLVVALWVTVIMGFASDGFSASSTSHYLTPLLRWLDPDMAWERIRAIHFLVRKVAHVVEYAVLAVLAFRAFRVTLAVPLMHLALLTLGVVSTVAGLDEWRQSLIPTRTGTMADIALDCAGGAVGVLVLIAIHRRLGVRSPAAGSGA
jgi:VanZ family protein